MRMEVGRADTGVRDGMCVRAREGGREVWVGEGERRRRRARGRWSEGKGDGESRGGGGRARPELE